MDRTLGRGNAPKLSGDICCKENDDCYCKLTLNGTEYCSDITLPCHKQSTVVTYVCMHVCMCVCVSVCLYACMYE